MTIRFLYRTALYVSERDLCDVVSFVNEVLSDMRGGDVLAGRMYGLFFESSLFRGKVCEFVLLQRSHSLGPVLCRLKRESRWVA